MLASITTDITAAVARDGVYAVAVLMALDALLPVASELVMLHAGALGATWDSVHRGFRYVDYAVVLAVLAIAGAVGTRRRRRTAVT